MFNCKLIVDGYSLDLSDEFPISINSSISEIQEIDKVKGTFSKTIILPGTKTNNKFFENKFNVNIALQTFNPNKVEPCQLVISEVDSIGDANLKLNNINVILKNNYDTINYEVLVYANNTDLFNLISDSYLHDLDFSEYDHTYNRSNAIASWSTAVGSGYKYPIIDYGNKQFQEYYFHIEHLRPALPLREYLLKMFNAIGKTWTSDILDSDFFKRLYIPHNGDVLNMSESTANNFQFYAGRLSDSVATNYSMTYNSFYSDWKNSNPYYTLSGFLGHLPNDDSTSPFNDAGGVYNTTTGIWTCGTKGFYTFKGQIKQAVKLNTPAGTSTISGNYNAWVYLLKWNGSSWIIVSANFYQNVGAGSTSYLNVSLDFKFTFNVDLGEQLIIGTVYLGNGQNGGITFKDGSNNPITTGTASLDVKHISGTWSQALLANTSLKDGNNLVMNDCIPRDYKQRDLFLSVCKMFNLYVQPDKENTNNYIIETRDEFYANGVPQNWSDKLAEDYPFNINPNVVNAKTYLWRYKSDKDYYNTDYEKRFLEPFGSKTKVIDNDFLKNEYKTEVIFSPTIITDNTYNDMVIPKIIDYDNINVKPLKHNIRLLYFGGLKSSGNTWDFTDSTGASAQTQYPFFGMCDDPTNDTLSLTFGIPAKIYHDDPDLTITNNNLYNKYYYRMIEEIADKDSVIVTCYVYLNPSDVFNFDFRNPVYLDKTYYIVNKIIDYNPLKKGLTKVELLKLKNIPAFVPEELSPFDVDINVGVGYGEGTGMETGNYFGATNENVGAGNNLIAGDMISVSSEGTTASGTGISVGKSSSNITVVSCEGVIVGDNVSGCSVLNTKNSFVGNGTKDIVIENCENISIEEGVEQVTLVNCSDIIIESGVLIFTGIGLSAQTITPDFNGRSIYFDSNGSEFPTDDFDITLAKEKYYPDASALVIDIEAQLPVPSAGMKFYVQNMGTVNNINVNSTAGIDIQGAASYALVGQYTGKWFEYNGTEWIVS